MQDSGKTLRTGALCAALLTLAATAVAAQTVRSPEEFLGHRVGADYRLARWPQIVDYFREIDAASDRVTVHDIGVTSEGQPMIYAEISTPESLARREQHQANQFLISDPRRIADATERQRLVSSSKPVILVNCALHASEIGSTQMAMELLWQLATGEDKETLEILEGTIVLLIPSANPDGLNMVADWYESSIGTPWEGRGLPWIYQKYAGHDNNRDWFMLNLIETKNETKVIYQDWRPTIIWDVHQMGNQGARLFVPPFHDPKNQNVPPLIDQTLLIIGGQMAQGLSRQGKTGVIHGAIYDNWWAGGFRTGVYRHNMVGILTEAASANVASPVFQRKSELRGARRGLPKYQMATNFPEPWPGGWWRLRDIVEYELSIARSLFVYAARYHETLQDNYIHMGQAAIDKGLSEPPFAWLVPPDQRDPASVAWMLDLLSRTGIEIHRATTEFSADGVTYPAGTYILYCAQPYRAHLMDMMERQIYPDRELYPGGPAEPPYDMAGWTLPLQMGVRRVAVATRFQAAAERIETIEWPQGRIQGSGNHYVVVAGHNDDYRLLNRLARAEIAYQIYTGSENWNLGGNVEAPAGSIVIGDEAAVRRAMPDLLDGLSTDLIAVPRISAAIQPTIKRASAPRIGLYQPWGGSMDEGWTRYVFDHFEYEYTTLHNADILAGQLDRRYDVVVFPSIPPRQILSGMAPDSTAPQYTGGIGPDGIVALQDFASSGGTLVFIDQSTNLAIDEFNIPVENVVRGKPTEEFFCPGSVLRVSLDPTHPLAYGMPRWVSGYFARSQAFDLGSSPTEEKEEAQAPDAGRSAAERFPTTVVGRYSDTVLLESGWIRGADLIRDKPAIAQVEYGDGKLILLGFGVQRRAQPHGTFRLLFNAMQSSTISD